MAISQPLVVGLGGQNSLGSKGHLYEGFQPCPCCHAEMCVIWPLKHFLRILHGSAEYSAESLEKIAKYSVLAEPEIQRFSKDSVSAE